MKEVRGVVGTAGRPAVIYCLKIDTDKELGKDRAARLRRALEETLDRFFGTTPFGVEFEIEKGLDIGDRKS